MYSIGDSVIYPGTGICIVEDIKKQKFSGMEERDYYILKSVYDTKGEKYFVPVEGGVKLRKPLTKKEIDFHIKTASESNEEWIADDRQRQKVISAYIREEDSIGILKSVALLYEEKRKKEEMNKKLRLSDERLLNEGIKLLHREFAYSLEIEVAEVESYIASKWKMEN